MATPRVHVAGPVRLPMPYGLFSVLGFREEADAHWEMGGISWDSSGASLADAVVSECSTDGEPQGLPKSLEGDGVEFPEADVFTIYATEKCTPIGIPFDEVQLRASERLQSVEEMTIETIIWEGTYGIAPSLADSIEVGEAATNDLANALGALEQAFALLYGGLGVLHVSRQIATLLYKQARLESRGGRLYTPLGTPVVAGGGYQSDKMVMTPPLIAYRSEVFMPSGRVGDLLDRANNDLYGMAERTYVVGFDSSYALHVTLTPASSNVGPPGASAYEVAVQNGFEGTEEEWLTSLVGPQGEQGDPGQPGADGEDGAPGQDGAPGVVQSIVAGTGVTVDDTDPANPIIGTE